ncbi:MAG: glycosyltransferase family 39 protein, partial [Actinomycetota bacterium]
MTSAPPGALESRVPAEGDVHDRAASAAASRRAAWELPVLALVVVAGALYAFLQALGRVTPWIFPDELLYAEAQRALVGRGRFGVADEIGVDGILHTIVHAPLWLLGGVSDAFTGIKAVNSVLWACAAIPVFLLARRYVGAWAALAAAAAAISIPAVVYTGTLMQEPVAYPLAATVVLLGVRLLERPTVRGAVGVAVATAAAAGVRSQLVAIGVAVLLAALIDGALRLRRHAGPS